MDWRLLLVACLITLTGCQSWFGGSSKKSFTTQSASTASPEDTTMIPASWFAKKKASPDLYVATARLAESRGDFEGAAAQYEKVLKDSPDYVPALLSYAHLQDHQNKLAEATKLYERAVKANPKEAGAYNDLGLCYARRGMATEALTNLGKAVQLQPDKALYRNNLACVLVDQHRLDDALVHLRAVNTDAVANYNMGILLEQRKQDMVAQTYFQRALQLNPSFAEARQWSEQLAKRQSALAQSGQQGPAQAQATPPSGVRIASVPNEMQRPAMYNGMNGTITVQAGASAMPPTPDAIRQMANVPTSMQRPNTNGNPFQQQPVTVQPGQPAMPPLPGNSVNSEIRSLPPVQ